QHLFIGYLFQLFSASEGGGAINDYRRLRALKIFLKKIIDLAGETTLAANQHLRTLEGLIEERDRWIAQRDQAHAALVQRLGDDYTLLGTDRDNWRRLATERDDDYTLLGTDRDNWRRLATERQDRLERLDRTL